MSQQRLLYLNEWRTSFILYIVRTNEDFYNITTSCLKVLWKYYVIFAVKTQESLYILAYASAELDGYEKYETDL